MSSLPSLSKSNTATPPGVSSGTTYCPSGQGAGLSSSPTALVISVKNPPDPAGPHCESFRAAAAGRARSPLFAPLFSSSRLQPTTNIARQTTAQLHVSRTIIFPRQKELKKRPKPDVFAANHNPILTTSCQPI